MKVIDIINNNDFDTFVCVQGEKPNDSCGYWLTFYYYGELGLIPEELFDCDVLYKGIDISKGCFFIEIPWRGFLFH